MGKCNLATSLTGEESHGWFSDILITGRFKTMCTLFLLMNFKNYYKLSPQISLEFWLKLPYNFSLPGDREGGVRTVSNIKPSYLRASFVSPNSCDFMHVSQGRSLAFATFLQKNILFIIFRHRRREGERKGESELHAPNWGPSRQPRHVPLLGIEPVTLWFAGWCSVHWATPARVSFGHFWSTFL